MAKIFTTVGRWFGWGGALRESDGEQHATPGKNLTANALDLGVDGALQMSAVWACIERRASAVASLPFFVYEQKNGQKKTHTQRRSGQTEEKERDVVCNRHFGAAIETVPMRQGLLPRAADFRAARYRHPSAILELGSSSR